MPENPDTYEVWKGGVNEQLTDEVDDPTHPADLGESLGGPTSIDPLPDADSPSSPAYAITWPDEPLPVIETLARSFTTSVFEISTTGAPKQIASQRRSRRRLEVRCRTADVEVYIAEEQNKASASGGSYIDSLDGIRQFPTQGELWAIATSGAATIEVIEYFD